MPVISHLSFSPSGGAGRVMTRLSAEQQAHGWISRVFFPLATNLRDKPFSLPLHTGAAAIDNLLASTKRFGSPVSLLRDCLRTSLNSIPSESDIIHLHWINGVSTIETIRKRFPKARLVWTLHDMNPFTGVCHQALSCKGFVSDCRSCPAVKTAFRKSVQLNFRRKEREILGNNVSIVVPSKWLAEKAESSPMLRGKKIHVVNNAIDNNFLEHPAERSSASQKHIVISVVAENLSDPLKRVAEVVAAHQSQQVLHSKILLRLIGAYGSAWSSDKNIEWLGRLNQAELKQAYADSDYILQASIGESFGLTLIEGASQGATPIVRRGEALEEIQRMLGTGYAFSSPKDLSRVLLQVATTPRPDDESRNLLKRKSRELFGPAMMLAQYDSIYAGLGISR